MILLGTSHYLDIWETNGVAKYNLQWASQNFILEYIDKCPLPAIGYYIGKQNDKKISLLMIKYIDNNANEIYIEFEFIEKFNLNSHDFTRKTQLDGRPLLWSLDDKFITSLVGDSFDQKTAEANTSDLKDRDWNEFINKNKSELSKNYGWELLFVREVLSRIPNLHPDNVAYQYEFVDRQGRSRRADFVIYVNNAKIAIEVDGWDKTGLGVWTMSQMNDLWIRQNALSPQVSTILRYNNSFFKHNKEQCISEISSLIDKFSTDKTLFSIEEFQNTEVGANQERGNSQAELPARADKMLWYTAVAVTIITTLAVLRMPLWYYSFFRTAVFAISMLAVLRLIFNKSSLFVIPLVVSIIYNPFLPVYLGSKSAWLLPNILLALSFWYVFLNQGAPRD